MAKSPDAFRTISEVSAFLDTQPHVLRFWETKFEQLKPVKRAGGRRYYRPGDVALLLGIKSLLHEQGMTIRGVQKMLREQGARHVASLAAQVEGAAGPGGVIMGPWAGGPPGLAPEAELDEEEIFDGEFEDAEPEEDEALDGAVADEPFEEDAEGPPAGSEAPTLIEAFLEGTLSRLAQGTPNRAAMDGDGEEEDVGAQEAPEPPPAAVPAAKPTLHDALALLRRADPERLRARADRIAPLVARLRALQAGLSPPRA